MLYGGNQIRYVDLNLKDTIQLASGRYNYQYVSFQKNQSLEFTKYSSLTLILLNGSIQVDETHVKTQLCSVQIEGGVMSRVTSLENNTVFLVAWMTGNDELKKTTSIRFIHENKKVEKPWGYEIWLTGEHPQYCFKKIFIQKGYKTSLQYHNYKEETNFLYSGEARLFFKSSNDVDNHQLQPQDIGQIDLKAAVAIDVKPNTLHRLEALTDITLYEVSTPEVDDVVRLQDDTQRPNGRIVSEHK